MTTPANNHTGSISSLSAQYNQPPSMQDAGGPAATPPPESDAENTPLLLTVCFNEQADQLPLPPELRPLTDTLALCDTWQKLLTARDPCILETFAEHLPLMLSCYRQAPNQVEMLLTNIITDYYHEISNGIHLIVDEARGESLIKHTTLVWRDAFEEFILSGEGDNIQKMALLLVHASRLLCGGTRLEFVRKSAMKHRTSSNPRVRSWCDDILGRYYLRIDPRTAADDELPVIDEVIGSRLEKSVSIEMCEVREYMHLLEELATRRREDSKRKRFEDYLSLFSKICDEQVARTAMRLADFNALIAAAHAAPDAGACCVALAKLLQTLAYRSRVNPLETEDTLRKLHQKLAEATFKMLVRQQAVVADAAIDDATREEAYDVERRLLSALIQMELAQFSVNLRVLDTKSRMVTKSTIGPILKSAYHTALGTPIRRPDGKGKKKKAPARLPDPLRSYLSTNSDDPFVNTLKRTLDERLNGKLWMEPAKDTSAIPLCTLLQNYLSDPYYQTNAADLLAREEEIHEAILQAKDNEIGRLIYSINSLQDPRLEKIKCRGMMATNKRTLEGNATPYMLLFQLAGTPDLWKESQRPMEHFPLDSERMPDPLEYEAIRRMVNMWQLNTQRGEWITSSLGELLQQLACSYNAPIWITALRKICEGMSGKHRLPQGAINSLLFSFSEFNSSAIASPTQSYEVVVLLCKILARSATSSSGGSRMYLQDNTVSGLISKALSMARSIEQIDDESLGSLLNKLIDEGMDHSHSLAKTLKVTGMAAQLFLHRKTLPKLNGAVQRLYPESYAAYSHLLEGKDSPEAIAKKHEAWIAGSVQSLKARMLSDSEKAAPSLSASPREAKIHAQRRRDIAEADDKVLADFLAAVDAFRENSASAKLPDRLKRFAELKRTYAALCRSHEDAVAAIGQRHKSALQAFEENNTRLEALRRAWSEASNALEASQDGFDERLTRRLVEHRQASEEEAAEMRQLFEAAQQALEGDAPVDWQTEHQKIERIRQRAFERMQEGRKPSLEAALPQPRREEAEQMDSLRATIRAQRKELQHKDREIAELRRQLLAQQKGEKKDSTARVENSRLFTQPELTSRLEEQMNELDQKHGAKTILLPGEVPVSPMKIRRKLNAYTTSPSKSTLKALYLACGMQKTAHEGSHMKYQFLLDDGSVLEDGSDTIAAHSEELCPKAITDGLRQVSTILTHLLTLPPSAYAKPK